LYYFEKETLINGMFLLADSRCRDVEPSVLLSYTWLSDR